LSSNVEPGRAPLVGIDPQKRLLEASLTAANTLGFSARNLSLEVKVTPVVGPPMMSKPDVTLHWPAFISTS